MMGLRLLEVAPRQREVVAAPNSRACIVWRLPVSWAAILRHG